ncbi:hypothetical protein Tsubulata_008781 [Turnera subulata]|uniref:Uncharacterized protein n=1 Tax=Turnera subulata TaxID=218843 RepID=A0A9Q0GA51_9ROSI|nr:hypothetical protein Tsubulata_008781 [Turnera subulata]
MRILDGGIQCEIEAFGQCGHLNFKGQFHRQGADALALEMMSTFAGLLNFTDAEISNVALSLYFYVCDFLIAVSSDQFQS